MRLLKHVTAFASAVVLMLSVVATADPTTAPANLVKPDADSWQAASQEGGSVSIAKDPAADAAHPALVLTIDKVDSTDWHAQVFQPGLSVTKDAKYNLTFTAKSDKPRKIAVFIQTLGAPYTMLSDGHAVDLTTDNDTKKVELVAKDNSSDVKLTIVVGQATGTVTISDISLTKAE